MFPTAVISAALNAMTYVNGRFAGEVRLGAPLVIPVSPYGALYLELNPLAPGYLPMARRVTLSAGKVVPASTENSDGLYLVSWPDGTLEFELKPQAASSTKPLTGSLNGSELVILFDHMWIGGRLICALPSGAGIPDISELSDAIVMLGKCLVGNYMAVLSRDLKLLGLIEAATISLEDDGSASAVIPDGDLVGHATLERWHIGSGGLEPLSRESVWLNGTPNWPTSPEQAAIAAIEAAISGRVAESNGYLIDAMAGSAQRVATGFSACVPLKYGACDRPAVGLVKLENSSLATVRRLFYSSEPISSSQGSWRISSMEIEN